MLIGVGSHSKRSWYSEGVTDVGSYPTQDSQVDCRVVSCAYGSYGHRETLEIGLSRP